MYFDFDYYKDKVVAIHCKSKTQAKKWCKLMHKNGLKWSAKECESYFLKSSYNYYKENTCYSLHGSFCEIAWYQKHGYTIIEFEDIIAGKYNRREKMFTKKDLKNGDYVKLRDNEYYVYINNQFLNNNTSINARLYHNDLTHHDKKNLYDVMEVRRCDQITSIHGAFFSHYKRCTVYKREEQKLWNGMTYEEAHRKLWNALADGEVATKREWFELNNKNKEDVPYDMCFACEAAYSKAGMRDHCELCPLCNIGKEEDCLNGLYSKWSNAKGFEKFKLAHEIANLPWKEK